MPERTQSEVDITFTGSKSVKDALLKTMKASHSSKKSKVPGVVSFEFDIPRSAVFNVSSKPDNISDIAFADKGKFWKYNKKNKYAKELDFRWHLNNSLGQVDEIVGSFGRDFVSDPIYSNLGKPIYDRLWDTWNMSLNPGETLFKAQLGPKGKKRLDPVKVARHYGTKILGLDEVKLVSEITTGPDQIVKLSKQQAKYKDNFNKELKKIWGKKDIDALYGPSFPPNKGKIPISAKLKKIEK